MIVYLAHPITGLSYDDVHQYYETLRLVLKNAGFDVIHPMTGKGYLRTEMEFSPHGYGNPVSTNHAIVERDQWMVEQADLVLVDLVGATQRSIGCISELAWAHLLRKHTIVAMEDGNVHQHAFIIEMADVLFPTLEEAIAYMKKLPKGEW